MFCWEDMQCTLGPEAWLSLGLSLSGRADLAKLPVSHQRSVLSSVSTTCLTCGCATQVDPRNGVLTAAHTDGSVEPGDKALV